MAAVATLRASAASALRAMAGESPFLGASSSKTELRYCPLSRAQARSDMPCIAGHPPRHTHEAMSATVTSGAGPNASAPANREPIPMEPMEIPCSRSDSVRMWTRAMRPAPLWLYPCCGGSDDPVSR